MNNYHKSRFWFFCLLLSMSNIAWADLQEEPFTGTLKTDIAFVIDDTESMAEELPQIVRALDQFIEEFKKIEGTRPFIELLTFKDDVTSRIVTNDLDLLQKQIDSLIAVGGDDCPEASLQALNQATIRLKKGGRILFATDASPTPNTDVAETTALLQQKNIKMDALLSGDCAPDQLNQ